MDILLIILVVGLLIILSFCVGAKIGQTVKREEEIKLPSLDPMQMIRESRSKKKAENEQSRRDIIMQNIEKYDGTANGQREVPRG